MKINYPNLASLWFETATAKNQGVEEEVKSKHRLIETTVELTNRIKNLDKSISDEEVSNICNRVLKQFNQLTPERQEHIAEYVGTLGETGYEHLYNLFQVIGETQLLPNYFAPQPSSSKSLLSVAIYRPIEIFTALTKIRPAPPVGIINFGIKTREPGDRIKIPFYKLGVDIRNQIISYLNKPSKIALTITSKKGIAQFINVHDIIPFKMGVKSIDDLIDYLKSKCKHVKKMNTALFLENFDHLISKDLLLRMQKAFPHLKELCVHGFEDDAPTVLKNFKSLRHLHIQDSSTLKDQNFLLNFSSLAELSLSKINLQRLNVTSLLHLIRLSIVDSPELTTIDNIKKLESLSELFIKNCQHMDLNILKDIPNLRKVAIASQEYANCSCLANHPYIYDLDISRSKIENFDFLFTMPALKYLSCVESNLPKEIKRQLRQKGIIVDTWLAHEDLS